MFGTPAFRLAVGPIHSWMMVSLYFPTDEVALAGELRYIVFGQCDSVVSSWVASIFETCSSSYVACVSSLTISIVMEMGAGGGGQLGRRLG